MIIEAIDEEQSSPIKAVASTRTIESPLPQPDERQIPLSQCVNAEDVLSTYATYGDRAISEPIFFLKKRN
jgi:hypothetical protein